MRAKMEVLVGAKTSEVTLRLPTVIGRGGEAKLKLPASTVSRHHCELYEYEDQIVVRDLGSSNGTVVNGHRIKGPTFLTPDDELKIGPVTVRLTRLAESSPPPVNPMPVDTELDRDLPDLQQLPQADDELPVTAAVADLDAEPSADAAEDSVLEYAEPKSSGRSFVGITHSDAGSTEAVTEVPVFGGIEEPIREVATDDSDLHDFFKNLDP